LVEGRLNMFRHIERESLLSTGSRTSVDKLGWAVESMGYSSLGFGYHFQSVFLFFVPVVMIFSFSFSSSESWLDGDDAVGAQGCEASRARTLRLEDSLT
jgi:hypothetical protein